MTTLVMGNDSTTTARLRGKVRINLISIIQRKDLLAVWNSAILTKYFRILKLDFTLNDVFLHIVFIRQKIV